MPPEGLMSWLVDVHNEDLGCSKWMGYSSEKMGCGADMRGAWNDVKCKVWDGNES